MIAVHLSLISARVENASPTTNPCADFKHSAGYILLHSIYYILFACRVIG